jgi:hypothetical protein
MLIKVHVPGGDDAVRNRIIAVVAFGVSRVTKEGTRNGARGEFVRGDGSGTRIAATTKYAEAVIGRGRPGKKMVWRVVLARTAWAETN